MNVKIEEIKTLCAAQRDRTLAVFINGVKQTLRVSNSTQLIFVRADVETGELEICRKQKVNYKKAKQLLNKISLESNNFMSMTEQQEKDKKALEKVIHTADSDGNVIEPIGMTLVDFLKEQQNKLQVLRFGVSNGFLGEGILEDAKDMKGIVSYQSLTDFRGVNFITSDYYLLEKFYNEKDARYFQYNVGGVPKLLETEYNGIPTVQGLKETYMQFNTEVNITLSKAILDRVNNHAYFKRMKLMDDFVPLYVKVAGIRNVFWETYDIEGFTLTADRVEVPLKYINTDEEEYGTHVVYTTRGRFADVFGVYPKDYRYSVWSRLIAGALIKGVFPNAETQVYFKKNEKAEMRQISKTEYMTAVEQGIDNYGQLSSIALFLTKIYGEQGKNREIVDRVVDALTDVQYEDFFQPMTANKYGYLEGV